MQELLPQSIQESLPPLYSQEYVADPVVYVKFFTPDSNWTWYATEYDPERGIFFGLVRGFEEELGYFLMAELKDGLGPYGLHIERDEHFSPMPLSEARKR